MEEIKNKKSKIKNKVLSLGISVLVLLGGSAFAQDNEKIVSLSKQVMEAKSPAEAVNYFEGLKDIYFNDHKYAEFAQLAQSFIEKKKDLEAVSDYYIALSRYSQLKYLEEGQNWDEYFSKGNDYRDAIISNAKKAVDLSQSFEPVNIYARLLLWKFHQGQQDNLAESSLDELLNANIVYAANSNNLQPIKDSAEAMLSLGEKARANQLYKIYADKLIAVATDDAQLAQSASGFYKEGNLELSEAIYDAYIGRMLKSTEKDKAAGILKEIARNFAYKGGSLSDPFYAEKVFKKLQELSGKDAFDQELIYLRAYNLEKIKEFKDAKVFYQELASRFPESAYAQEALYKTALMDIYIMHDAGGAKSILEKLSQNEAASPYSISALYQLGLINQWSSDDKKAKEYYDSLIAKAKDGFSEIVALAKARLMEIESAKPLEYNLRTFLDLSLKDDLSQFDMSKVDLRANPYRVSVNEKIKLSTNAYTSQSGCFAVELQYLWSGDLGGASQPTGSELEVFYAQPGTKEIFLVVVSPSGVLDRAFDMVDVR